MATNKVLTRITYGQQIESKKVPGHAQERAEHRIRGLGVRQPQSGAPVEAMEGSPDPRLPGEGGPEGQLRFYAPQNCRRTHTFASRIIQN